MAKHVNSVNVGVKYRLFVKTIDFIEDGEFILNEKYLFKDRENLLSSYIRFNMRGQETMSKRQIYSPNIYLKVQVVSIIKEITNSLFPEFSEVDSCHTAYFDAEDMLIIAVENVTYLYVVSAELSNYLLEIE
jgi:hypothetical protein